MPLRFPTALARLLTDAQPFHLDVARYAFDETAAHLSTIEQNRLRVLMTDWGSKEFAIYRRLTGETSGDGQKKTCDKRQCHSSFSTESERISGKPST
ncbi:hypothetical protein [Prevotella sp. OH937_COT-195]|uniref:hypothetical protein n=1 Tax=Prevotella sp. OH937_COT-195 TaxID=2491051 RepID=UPI000F649C5B|nr:hypothetical protein [Prevotella sp. OH937_COT-195]RRD00786.1 hypothetical protein EII32_06435 [Prevotella sp. OH937_COT-195]